MASGFRRDEIRKLYARFRYHASETTLLQPSQRKMRTAGRASSEGRLARWVICRPHSAQVRDGVVETDVVIDGT